MQQEHYEISVGKNFLTAEFVSQGTNGAIKKWIVFEKTDIPDLYNLAFGDKYTDKDDFDDTSISNNGDTQKVLATLAYTVVEFTSVYPKAWVYAKGSSAARTRLYQMGINKYFEEIAGDFEIIAETEDNWEIFTKGKNYYAFAVRRNF